MGRLLGVSVLSFGLVISFGMKARSAQADSFLPIYYTDNETVSCRDYGTANGARLATYQWWLLGFVSGAGHVRSTIKLPVARIDAVSALGVAADYCAANPVAPLASAATAIVTKLGSAQSGK